MKDKGALLHRRVMKRLEPDGPPQNKKEAERQLRFCEYLIANPPDYLDEPETKSTEDFINDLLEEIENLELTWGLESKSICYNLPE